MADGFANYTPRPMLGLLLRVKARSLANRVGHAVNEAPVRITAAVLMLILVWVGLYGLFATVFHEFRRTPLEATVALPLIFNFFFVAILVMLTFSNAIIVYTGLFGKDEPSYLLTSPLTPLDIVTVKFLESLALASWSLILLGLPLMLAMARRAQDPAFYLLFIAFFLAFIPIPAALGLLLAWGSARYFPRRYLRTAAVLGGIAIAALNVWGLRSLRIGDAAAETWLRSFLARMSFVESAFLPNTWVATGIDHAQHRHLAESALYLGVTIANALFISWLVVRFVAKRFPAAHDRASAGFSQGRRPASRCSGGLAGWTFLYLPRTLRLIAAKDLRTFFRDPLQWSQLVILFGLMALYLTNMPTWRLQFGWSGWSLVIPFLNLCAVSLILATFTCRFVFPLVSLEGRQLWLIGLLPMKRGHILLAKFAFAMTVTLLVGLAAMGMAAVMLELSPTWTALHLGVIVAVCFGLCGFSVGLGARLPMFHQGNAARIANGMGGTTNLLASVALVAVVLAGVGVATWHSRDGRSDDPPTAATLGLCLASVVTGVASGLVALWIGSRHFNRVEV